MKRIFIYSIYIFIILLSSCSDSLTHSNIPDVSFRFAVNLQEDTFLNAPGNYRIFNGVGYKGVIVYNLDGNSFYAYDMACPHKDGNHKLSTSSTKGSEPVITCEKCGSIFNLIDAGAPVKAPAVYPLRSYNCVRSNMLLHISN